MGAFLTVLAKINKKRMQIGVAAFTLTAEGTSVLMTVLHDWICFIMYQQEGVHKAAIVKNTCTVLKLTFNIPDLSHWLTNTFPRAAFGR